MRRAGFLVICLLFCSGAAFALPYKIPVGISLFHADNTTFSGTDNINFLIYDVPTGGTPLWNETQKGLNITHGALSTLLGNVYPINISFKNVTYWLELQINNSQNTLSPRIEFSARDIATSYEAGANFTGNISQATFPASAFNCTGTNKIANISIGINGLITATCDADVSGGGATSSGWSTLASTIYNDTVGVKIGIGTSSPLATLEVTGVKNLTDSTPGILIEQTWNNAARSYCGYCENINDSASAAASMLINLTINNARKFSVDKSGTMYVQTIDFISSKGTGGVQPQLRDVDLNNVFWQADKRFSMKDSINLTLSQANAFFDGTYETGVAITRNTSTIISINNSNTTQFGTPLKGWTYPDGDVYISYYVGRDNANVTLRVYANGAWVNGAACTNSNPDPTKTKITKCTIPSSNYLQIVELNITTNASLTTITAIDYICTRCTTEMESPFFDKTQSNQTMAGDLQMFDKNGNITGRLGPGINYFGVGPGKVAIGTPNATEKLTIVGNVSNILDVTFPANQVSASFAACSSIVSQGKFAYCLGSTGSNSTIKVYDITNAVSPRYVSTTFFRPRDDGANNQAFIQGNYIFAVGYNSNRTVVYDISNPLNLSFVSDIDTPSGRIGSGNQLIYVDGAYVFIQSLYRNLMIYDYTDPYNPVEIYDGATTGISIGYPRMTKCGNFIFQAGNTDYDNGTFAITDVSDPFNPVIIYNFTNSTTRGFYGVACSSTYAYLAERNNNRTLIFDYSNVTNGIVPIVRMFNTTDPLPAYLKVADRYLYVIANGGTYYNIYDLKNPTNPELENRFYTNGGNEVTLSGINLFVPRTYSASTMWQLPGIVTASLTAYSAEISSLNVVNTINAQSASLSQSLSVGGLGIFDKGSLTVLGTSTFQNNVTVNGNGLFNSNLTVKSASSISGITMFNESARAWCVRVSGEGTLQAIEGAC